MFLIFHITKRSQCNRDFGDDVLRTGSAMPTCRAAIHNDVQLMNKVINSEILKVDYQTSDITSGCQQWSVIHIDNIFYITMTTATCRCRWGAAGTCWQRVPYDSVINTRRVRRHWCCRTFSGRPEAATSSRDIARRHCNRATVQAASTESRGRRRARDDEDTVQWF